MHDSKNLKPVMLLNGTSSDWKTNAYDTEVSNAVYFLLLNRNEIYKRIRYVGTNHRYYVPSLYVELESHFTVVSRSMLLYES